MFEMIQMPPIPTIPAPPIPGGSTAKRNMMINIQAKSVEQTMQKKGLHTRTYGNVTLQEVFEIAYKLGRHPIDIEMELWNAFDEDYITIGFPTEKDLTWHIMSTEGQ